MGVPNFYSWLVRRYPLCLYDYSTTQVVDYLYMDMNQVIYKCATDPTVLFKDQLRERNFDDVWVSILGYLDMVISMVNPQQVVFLALDGVAPRAKMNQQRQRRFQSSKRYAYLSAKLQQVGVFTHNETYKTNQFSPGTEFMTQLNQQIKFFVERKYIEDPRYKNLKVIFSGSDVPGEGEHKLLSFARNLDCDPQTTHMIYGADADLIMLGMLVKLQNVLIVRENLKFKQEVSAAASRIHPQPEFQVINIQIVKECLHLEYSPLQEKMKMPFIIDRVIDDFILLCFFVGNDFLPRVYCFDIRIGTIEALIELFKKHLVAAEQYIVTQGDINFNELLRLLDLLKGFEKLCINERQREMQNYLQNEHIRKEEKMIQQMMQKYVVEQTEGRKFFYMEKCKILVNGQLDMKQLEEMCINYVEGIQFVLYYYYKGVPSWEWYYKFYYAPLCDDIFSMVLRVVQSFTEGEKPIIFEPTQPYPPFKQLLSILSPENADLLPPQYGRLLTDRENSILRNPIDYYPDKFEIDTYGTIYEHQYITKIPFLNAETVELAYQSVPDNDDPRNRRGTSLVYHYDGQPQEEYQSTLPTLYDNFKSISKKQTIDLESAQDCKQHAQKYIKDDLYQVPTFQILQLKSGNLQEIKDDEKTFCSKQMQIEIQHTFNYDPFIEEVINNNYFVYCGFPIQVYSQIVALMRIDQLNLFNGIKFSNIKLLIDYSKKDHLKYFKDLQYKARSQYDRLGLQMQCNVLAIVRQYKYYIRDNNNQLSYPQQYNEVVYPIEFTFTKRVVNLRVPYHEDFQIDRQVVIFHEKLNGATGIIKQVGQKLNVQITRVPFDISYEYVNQDRYYSLQFVSEKMQCTLSAVLNLLGSVVVLMDESKESKISESLDIGLNIINRTTNMLVPELVRLPQADQYAKGTVKYQQFKDLELSEECVNILCLYRNQCPRLFQFLNNSKDKQPIKSTELFPRSSDSNIDLLKLYIWILQLPSSQYLLQGSSSKVAKIKITKIGNPSQFKMKKVDQGYAVQQTLATYLPPFFTKHPTIHKIGDRVVNLKHPFGIHGTVVGLLEQKDILVQVLWDQCFIGFSNLGGRYGLLKCSVCKFTDIFNITNSDWRLSLAQKGSYKGETWDLYTKVYIPDFKSKPIVQNDQLQPQNPFSQLIELPPEPVPKVLIKQQEQSTADVLEQILQKRPELVTTQPLEGVSEQEINQQNVIVEELFKIEAQMKEQQKEQKQVTQQPVKKVLQKKKD